MRLLPALIALPLLGSPALAQTQPDPPSHPRLTWEQRFAQANVSHDGHLTLEQAKAGYHTLVRHFQEIDTGGKGYLTEDDIRAWHLRQRSAHRQGSPTADDGLQPRDALHRMFPERRSFNTSTTRTIPLPPDIPTPPPEPSAQAPSPAGPPS